MNVKYDFNLSKFPNSTVNGGILHKEVENTSISGFLYINVDPNGAEVWFDNTLSAEDEITLSGVISSHGGEALLSLAEVIADEPIGKSKAVYIYTANRVRLAKADSEDTLPPMGFTIDTVSSGETIFIQTNDILGGFSGLIPGAEYYLSQTVAGEITTQKPQTGAVVRVGTAKNSTEMDIHLMRLEEEIQSDYAVSDGESSTTSTSWQEKTNLQTSNIPAGTYEISWFFEWSFSRTTPPGAKFGVHVNWGAITVSEIDITPTQSYGDGGFYASSGFGYVDLDSGSHKIAINYRAGGDSSTAYIRRARIKILRIPD